MSRKEIVTGEREALADKLEKMHWEAGAYPISCAELELCINALRAAPPASPLRGTEMDLKTSEEDETLMRATLLKCYSKGPYAFRVSKEHYLYLAEQIIALREGSRRMAAASPLRGREAVIEECARVADALTKKWGQPNGEDYNQGMNDHGIRIASNIRALASASPPEQPAAMCPKCKTKLQGPRLVTPNPHKDMIAYWCLTCDYTTLTPEQPAAGCGP